MENSRSLRVCLLISSVILIALAGFRFMGTRSIKFDPDEWKRAKNKGITSLRYRMVGDLVSRLEGARMSYKDALDMLGEPDRRDGVDRNNGQPRYMTYQLGLENRFIPSGRFYLQIEFDPNGFVNGTKVNPE